MKIRHEDCGSDLATLRIHGRDTFESQRTGRARMDAATPTGRYTVARHARELRTGGKGELAVVEDSSGDSSEDVPYITATRRDGKRIAQLGGVGSWSSPCPENASLLAPARTDDRHWLLIGRKNPSSHL